MIKQCKSTWIWYMIPNVILLERGSQNASGIVMLYAWGYVDTLTSIMQCKSHSVVVTRVSMSSADYFHSYTVLKTLHTHTHMHNAVTHLCRPSTDIVLSAIIPIHHVQRTKSRAPLRRWRECYFHFFVYSLSSFFDVDSQICSHIEMLSNSFLCNGMEYASLR